MAKFLKSIFTPDKRKTSRVENENEGDRDDFTPPLDGRRHLSISRSGRMKQANKKRQELNLDLYGEEHQHEKPKNMEYHVNKVEVNRHHGSAEKIEERKRSRSREDIRTPEEEIESAFEIIDKIS